MKILMVNKFLFPKGGAETYMFELAKCLEKNGNELQFFGMDNSERCVSNRLGLYVDEIDYKNISALKKLAAPLKTIYSKEAAKKIGMVLDDFKPDIVHLNNINFQLTPSIIYAAKKRNIPVVQTVHDVQIACPNHRMYIEEKEQVCEECVKSGYTKCIKNKCVQGSVAKSAIAAAESIYYHRRNTYNLVDRYICPSEFMARQIKAGGVEEKRITVLHNYSPSIAEIPENINDGKYIIYFGRVSIEKGLKLLLDVMSELKDVKLYVAGTGPLEEELKARQLENVSFLGFKSGTELYSLIAGAIASVYPSQWYENCPMSVIESIKLGTPVITCDIGGTKELIENGKNGLIYKADNKEELKKAIETLYNSDSLAEEMSRYCLEHGSTDSLEKYAEKIEKIYKEIIK